jgi:superfamily II helicase
MAKPRAPAVQAELVEQAADRPKTLAQQRNLCPRCFLRGKLAALVVGHSCPCLDAVCERCDRPLSVTVVAVDARGSHSERSPCGCFYAPATRKL